MKTVSVLLLLGMFCSGVCADEATQVLCKEVGEDSKKRVYALVRHQEMWNVIYKSPAKPKWVRLPLLSYKPRLTDNTLQIDYTSPLGGVRVKWTVRGEACSLFISNAYELEVNDPAYMELDPAIDEMNTGATLKNLSCKMGALKIKLDQPSTKR